MRFKFFLKILIAGMVLIVSTSFINTEAFSKKSVKNISSAVAIKNNDIPTIFNLYNSLRLDSLGLSKEAFFTAINGLDSLQTAGIIKNNRIISIVDFSLPSYKKRLFIIDLVSGKLLFNTFVSHGKNSGKEMATKFSNDLNSFASSLGFYVTGDTYEGEHGYSLRLQGLEEGINDNAYDRSIVMHSAPYINGQVIKKLGYIGRSLGCPAIPVSVHKAIINTIKNGSCLFLYSPDEQYLSHSRFLKSSAVNLRA